ncbi:hypothetical protein O181_100461 [Austropuccinia psidii MF-1]|uniref:Uncharacterized protein n=1 Tax=Austropuccinia psidii MF-1 TaxID=1389203 RepID=A0A9Q3JFF2_9BASI|nr:hypothetical protein [Austropuccinia psidii MF-1]
MIHGLWGHWRPARPKMTPEPKFSGASGVPWPGPIRRVQDHKDSDLSKVAGDVMGGDFSAKETCYHHFKGFEGGPSLRYDPHFLEGIFFRLEVIQSDSLNILLAYSLFMSSKLTESTESSPSVPPPSILHGLGILSGFYSPSMASSGHFDPTQTYDGYKAVEVLDPACTECLEKGKDCFEH